MNTKRLLMLADYLEGVGQFEGKGVPKNKFDLELWMAPYDKFSAKFKIKADPNKDTYVDKIKKFNRKSYDILYPIECQTAGCAVGWATSIPEFNKLGLYLSATKQPIYFNKSNKTTYDSILAVYKFFDINDCIFRNLFVKSYYSDKESRNPVAVAKKIRKVVNDYLTRLPT